MDSPDDTDGTDGRGVSSSPDGSRIARAGGKHEGSRCRAGSRPREQPARADAGATATGTERTGATATKTAGHTDDGRRDNYRISYRLWLHAGCCSPGAVSYEVSSVSEE